jgi:Protein of unknown function (DUF2892)
MKTNVGGIDRGLRIVLGGSLIAWAAAFDGPVLAYLGVIPLLTGVFGMCGLYSLLGINTCRIKD